MDTHTTQRFVLTTLATHNSQHMDVYMLTSDTVTHTMLTSDTVTHTMLTTDTQPRTNSLL